MMNIKVIICLISFLHVARTYSSNFSTTSTDDTIPPIISNLKISSIQSTKAIISWDTDEVADTSVSFNVVGSNEKKISGNLNYSLNHTLVLTKLTPLTNYVIIVSSTDTSGNTSSASINLGTNNSSNSLPIISGTPLLVMTSKDNYQFTPSANDSDGDNLSFSIINKPSWATFDNQTGALTGAPGVNGIGTNSNIIISVSDGTVSVNLPAFSIRVDATPPENNNSDTITSSYTAPSGATYTNIVKKTPGATTTTGSDNTTIQSSVGNVTQQIIMYNDGKILSSVSNTGSSPHSAIIESLFHGTETSLLANGSIQFKANPNNNLNIVAEINNNGSILQTSTFKDVSGQDRISNVSTSHEGSKLDLSQSGTAKLFVTFDALITNPSGQIQNVETNALVTTSTDGSVQLQINQSDSNISINNLLNLSKTFNPGASVTIEGEIIKVSNIIDRKVDF
jgi:hypothetical protein